jgi:hypothetical protein
VKLKKEAWVTFKAVTTKFLRNFTAENYESLVEELLKIHFLDPYLNPFLTMLSTVSVKHGECYHQEISMMETSYQGKSCTSTLADCCWALIIDAQAKCKCKPEATFSGKFNTQHLL